MFCLFTALRFHELTTQSAPEVWIALPEKARRPRLDYRETRDLDLLRRGDGDFEAIRADLRTIIATLVPPDAVCSTARASTWKRFARRMSMPPHARRCAQGAAKLD